MSSGTWEVWSLTSLSHCLVQENRAQVPVKDRKGGSSLGVHSRFWLEFEWGISGKQRDLSMWQRLNWTLKHRISVHGEVALHAEDGRSGICRGPGV